MSLLFIFFVFILLYVTYRYPSIAVVPEFISSYSYTHVVIYVIMGYIKYKVWTGYEISSVLVSKQSNEEGAVAKKMADFIFKEALTKTKVTYGSGKNLKKVRAILLNRYSSNLPEIVLWVFLYIWQWSTHIQSEKSSTLLFEISVPIILSLTRDMIEWIRSNSTD